jgi:hypothetical protein
MNNKTLLAVLLAFSASSVFAQPQNSLSSAFERALSGLKAAPHAQVESVQGVPATERADAATRKDRYYYFASIQVQSREVVSRQGSTAVLKFKGAMIVRNFNSGIPLADPVAVEFSEEVAVSPKGGVNAYITPQITGVKLYIKDRLIGLGDFNNGSFGVQGKVTESKVRVSGSGRIWGWVEIL